MSEFSLITFFQFKEGGQQKLQEFQESAKPLFLKYGLSIRKEFAPIGQGQIGPVENTLERPDLVQIVSLESFERFQAYLADPEIAALAPIRTSGLRKMTASFGPAIDVSGVQQHFSLGSMHFVGLVDFNSPEGLNGLVEFNRRGLSKGLFSRYGIRVHSMAKVIKTIAPVGEAAFNQPHTMLHFSIDQPALLKQYITDPEYLSLAPVRDAGLQSYFFFQGF